jgi:hypothetical protein
VNDIFFLVDAAPVDALWAVYAARFTFHGLRLRRFTFHGLRFAVDISWLMPYGRFTASPVDASRFTPFGRFTLRGFLTNDSTCEAAVNNEVSTALRASTAKRNRLAKNANF